MPGLKARSTSGRSLQGQGLFHRFPSSPLSVAWASPPSPCRRPGLVDVAVFGFSPSHPGTSCAARCPIGAPLRPALPFPRFFAMAALSDFGKGMAALAKAAAPRFASHPLLTDHWLRPGRGLGV